jgi:CDP-diacylglycerol--serine O-phosphatidyltransferase
MKITRAVVPSLFTTLNIFCGFLAIINTNQAHFHAAAWFIILAAIFDSLDGVMARITKSSSQFGVELDSLADVVSFGAAPSFMVYQAYLYQWGNWGIMIASMPVIFGAIRLARFNVQLVGFDKDYFKGTPIPLQAMVVCAYFFQYYTEGVGFEGWTADGLAVLVIVLSFLMVSHVKYDTLPKLSKKQLQAHPWKVVGIILGILILIFSKGTLLFLMLAFYLLFGIIRYFVFLMKKPSLEMQGNPQTSKDLPSIDI